MRKISALLYIALLLDIFYARDLASAQISSQSETEMIFRFHIPSEPHSLDPSKITSTDASYFFKNVMRGLYGYSNEKGLIPEGAKSCKFESELKIRCQLAEDAFWSDGKKVEAIEYVRSFQKLVAPGSKNPSLELLKNIRNGLRVHSGQLPPESLGVKAEGADRLVFEFEKADPDFLYKLTASILVPIRSPEFPVREKSHLVPVNGPYKVASWQSRRRIRLEPNPFYKRGNRNRPPVEAIFVDDEHTAFVLYQRGVLSFLRRLPTNDIPRFRGRPELHELPVARFDYVGFGPELAENLDLRLALSHSADFKELQKIYNSVGIPGCPSLPPDFMDKERCVIFDINKAKMHWSRVPEELKKKRFKFYFSKLGGDDLKKGAEWFQSQWKKNLNLKIDLAQTEQGVFLQTLRTTPPAIFRKGVGLERPTCLAALETFSKDGSENFLGINDPGFEKILSDLTRTKLSSESKKLCGLGVQFLLDRAFLIPLGRFHFAHLSNTRFQGWTINEMNQLDLSGLELK